MKFRIPASTEHVRSIPDPNHDKIRIVHALVNVNDLPHDIPLDPDPRAPKITGAVPKKIVQSLESNDGIFHLKNRGITISAKECGYDNKHKILELFIPEAEEQFGVLDGAHTYECIKQTVTKLREKRNGDSDSETASGDSADHRVLPVQFVHLEILVRIESNLADIAEARNFSVALKPWTLANYRDKFDWLLESLGNERSKHIRVSENDPQPIGILDVIQVVSAVNPTLFPEEKPAIEAYKNTGKMLQAFVDESDKYQYRKLAPVCSDIMRLYDYVRLHFSQKYNAPDETGKRGRYGKTKESKEAKERRGSKLKATYYFLNGTQPVRGSEPIDKGFSIPLISGFRLLLEERNGAFVWLTDPMAFFDQYGTKLVRTVMSASDAKGGDPHTVGRDPQVYQQLTSEVRRWYLESKLSSQSK
jgi:hypothetical protein